MSTGINIAPSSDITVGTTAVTSGTDTRVFFQAGGVVQQDANFTFDNTLKRLTLKAVGTAVTDIPFRIFNSTETANLFYVAGNKALQVGGSMSSDGSSTYLYSATGVQQLLLAGNTLTMNANFNASLSASNNISLATNGGGLYIDVNGRISIGAGASPGARLDVRAQGALSTDIAFRVRNSADTANLFRISGEGLMELAQGGDTSRIGINATTIGQLAIAIGSGSSGLYTTCVGFGNTANGLEGVVVGYNNNAVSLGACGISIGANNTHTIGLVIGKSNSGQGSAVIGYNNAIGGGGPTNNGMYVFGSGMTETSGNAKLPGTFMFGAYSGTGNKSGLTFKSLNKNHLLLGYDIMNATYSSENGTNWLGIKTGTAPDGAVDAFQLYSADITAGNAAPHFRTEAGNIIKLYQQSSAGIATVGDLVTVLQNLGLLS